MINVITMGDVHTLQKRMLDGVNELGINMSFASRFDLTQFVGCELMIRPVLERITHRTSSLVMVKYLGLGLKTISLSSNQIAGRHIILRMWSMITLWASHTF